MTHSIDLAPDVEEIAARQAQVNGKSLTAYLPELLAWALQRQEFAPKATQTEGASVTITERIARFERWAESHDRNTPLLSDEAVSRAAIYGDNQC